MIRFGWLGVALAIGRIGLLGLCGVALTACQSPSITGELSFSRSPSPRAPQRLNAPSADAAPAASPASLGFTPLLSPQQVVAALPLGRPDPFAPVLAAPAKTPAAGDGLRFTGVIRSPYGTQALVQLGGLSGAVCVGPRGRCAAAGGPPLLPAGWSVSQIDVAAGRLVLNQAGQRLVLSL